MYCKYCGNKISDDAIFCAKCGKRQEVLCETPDSDSSVSERDSLCKQNIYNSKVQMRQEYRRGNYKLVCFGIVFDIILIAIGISFIISLPEIFRYSYRYSDYQTAKTLLIIAVVMEVLTLIMQIIRTVPLKNSFVCVTDDGVYGSGGSSLYFFSKEFCLYYNQITRVTVDNKCLIIESGGGTYRCIIDNEEITARQIRQNLTCSNNTIDNEVEFWVCKECGLKNKINIKVCPSCGEVLNEEIYTWVCPVCNRTNRSTEDESSCSCGYTP